MLDTESDKVTAAGKLRVYEDLDKAGKRMTQANKTMFEEFEQFDESAEKAESKEFVDPELLQTEQLDGKPVPFLESEMVLTNVVLQSISNYFSKEDKETYGISLIKSDEYPNGIWMEAQEFLTIGGCESKHYFELKKLAKKL